MESQEALPTGRRALWATVAVLGTVVLSLVPVLFEHRFYFADDTQAGAYGIWYSIGEHLRSGEIPLLEPTRWMAGNYAAEGQWGTFNPLVVLIGLVTYSVPNAVVLVTGLKVAFLATAALGVHLLARSYGARPEWAATGAVLAPAAGFVVYMDSASWVTGLMTWALLPSVWWALRRTANAGGTPLLPFAIGYLLITIGYVHGTLMLAVVILGVLLEQGLQRSRPAFLRTLLVGVLLGLVAAAVYLPGVLTAGVTARDSSGVMNDNFLSPDLSGFAASTIATANPWISGFWAPPVSAPILYITWLLPALAFVDWRRARGLVPSTAALWVVGVVALGFVLGPAELGPLRFPVRLTPYVVLAVVVVLVVLLSRAPARATRARSSVAVGIVVVGGYSAFAEQPGAVLSFGAAAVLALAGVLVVGRSVSPGPGRWRGPVALLTTVLTVTTATVVLQHRVAPASPLPDFGLPAAVAAYQQPLQGVQGDTLVVGVPDRLSPGPWGETLLSNTWYLNAAPVQNVYTPLQFRAYAAELCMDSHGEVCWEVLPTLFADDPTTGVPLVDLLAISNIQLVRRSDGGVVDPFADASPPLGWRVTDRGADTVLWSRDTPVAGAGGPVWTSPGTNVSVVEESTRSVRLHVAAAATDGGSVVLSRLAWPGYTVDGGALAEPLRDYLLRVDLPPGSAGTDVVVSFSPPGWTAELAALVTSVVGALLWAAVAALRGRRRIGPEPDPLVPEPVGAGTPRV